MFVAFSFYSDFGAKPIQTQDELENAMTVMYNARAELGFETPHEFEDHFSRFDNQGLKDNCSHVTR